MHVFNDSMLIVIEVQLLRDRSNPLMYLNLFHDFDFQRRLFRPIESDC